MKNFTQEQIEERFEELPDSVQEILASAETGEALRRIGTRHNLHIDQLSILNNVTGLVILGLMERSDYLPTLIEELDIATEVAEAILTDVNTEILEPMRASLGGPEEDPSDREEENMEEEDVHLPTRAELLKEIEHPAPAIEREESYTPHSTPRIEIHEEEERAGELPTQELQHESIVEKKIREKTVLKEARSEETQSGSNPSPTPETPLDPYREPVE
jgi:hypothetical protein